MTTYSRPRRALLIGTCLALCSTTLISTANAAAPAPVKAQTADPLKNITVDIPSTSFTLPNGLTVVVHEDHSAPLVAVNIWYHVGSKNEPAGKSGFAHLFEHLMFNGSENFNDDFFKATQKIGASAQNGTTNVDRTNYFQTVPKNALDTMLWLESDRMGHLLGAIDQAKLDEQRAVVKNERRQNYENKPYAKARGLIARATMPEGHPYHHLTIGSMADLDAASLDDVKDWFRTYYGPSNAVLVLAGDITPEEARAKVQKYFGDIAPGTPVSQPKSWVVPLQGKIRETAYDRVAAPRLYRVWNVANYSSADIDYLQFLGEVLAGDKNSRLYKRLVLDDQLATQVGAGVDNKEIGGQFLITATAKPGGDLKRIETIVDEELAALLKSGPTPSEMSRIRTSTIASYVRSLESISTKAGVLAEAQTYLGDADGWKKGFERFRDATPAQIREAGACWLRQGDYVLHIEPFGDLKATAGGADRKTMPMPGTAVPAQFPNVEQAELPNGMKLLVARRPGVPVVNLSLIFDTGIAPDYAQLSPVLGSVAMNLLDEATVSRSGEQLVAELGALGATLQTGGGGESSSVVLSALKPTLPQALGIFADVVRNPAFKASDLDRIKSQSLAALASQKQDPGQIASRVTSRLLFGANHAYGRIATNEAVTSIDRADVAAFHKRWFIPNNATLVVTGDIGLAEVRPLIERAFAGWTPGAVPETIAPTAGNPAQTIVYLVDKPGAAQSVVRAALIAPARSQGDDIVREAFNTAFGGSFTSRLNMKLREEKGWAYGARSSFGGGRGSRLFVAGGSVQADKTADTMTEMAALLKAATSNRKIAQSELNAAKDAMLLGLSSDWSNSRGIGSYLGDVVTGKLPGDYYERYPAEVANLTPEAVNAAAAELLNGKPLTWIVVGDLSKIEAPISALNLGQVRIVDADGNPVR